MRSSDAISVYIQRLWAGCARARTADETEEFSEKIDNLYDILAEVSRYERSLIAALSVD